MYEYTRVGHLLEFGLVFNLVFKNASSFNLNKENSCLQELFRFS